MVKRLAEVYSEIRSQLLKTEEHQDATMMARYLVSEALSLPLSQLFSRQDMLVPETVQQKLEQNLGRLAAGEPFAYVLGNWEFYGLPLIVSSDVLIPRDDTCAVTELAINHGLFLGKSPRILDLCCGSGCIGLAIASRLPDGKVTLADLSRDALQIARKNISLNHLGGRVSCIQLDAMAEPPGFLGKFDMLVSNPPYISKAEMDELPDSVKLFEPHMALYGGDDGLDFYKGIVRNFSSVLNPGGILAFEFGMGQGNDVCAILVKAGYEIIERKVDFNDRERAVLARYSGKDE